MNETDAERRLGRAAIASGLIAAAVWLFPVTSAIAAPYPPIPVLPTPAGGPGTIGGSEGPVLGGSAATAPVPTTLGPGEFPVQARTGSSPPSTNGPRRDVSVGIGLIGVTAAVGVGASVVAVRRRSHQG